MVASNSHQVKTSGHRQDVNIDIDVDMSDLDHQPASPFDIDNSFDLEAMDHEETVLAACTEPVTAAVQVNISVGQGCCVDRVVSLTRKRDTFR